MKRLIAVGLAGALLSLAAPAVTATVVVAALLNDGVASVAPAPGASRIPAGSRIPARMRSAYQRAASACPGLSWTVLAAIGTIESDNGQAHLPGVTSGHNAAGAAGPMQFEAATFAHYARPVPAGGADPPNPYDPLDASYAAARLLCANGAWRAAHLPLAIFAYNHSDAY